MPEKMKLSTVVFDEVAFARQGHFSVTDMNHFMGLFETESDRGVVLALGSILEDILRRRLEIIFCNGPSKIRASLYDMNGPLSTFSAKIDTLFCFGDITHEQRSDLHLVRRLRNKAAHSWADFNFSDEVEEKFISPIKNRLRLKEGEDGPELLMDARTKLLMAAAFFLMTLSPQFSNTPVNRTPGKRGASERAA